MKIRKNVKALSPVVASIILIAVTVAVSVVVAAWMGGMSIGLMGNAEQATITNMAFGPNSIAVTVNNTGTSPVTINEGWINNAKHSSFDIALPRTIEANKGIVINMTSVTVTNGYNYQVKLMSSKGNPFLYSAVAPTS